MIIEEKTYEIYATNKCTGYSQVMHLQVLKMVHTNITRVDSESFVIDMEERQMFHGTIEEYMEYCNYEIDDIQEREISCVHKLEVIENYSLFKI